MFFYILIFLFLVICGVFYYKKMDIIDYLLLFVLFVFGGILFILGLVNNYPIETRWDKLSVLLGENISIDYIEVGTDCSPGLYKQYKRNKYIFPGYIKYKNKLCISKID